MFCTIILVKVGRYTVEAFVYIHVVLEIQQVTVSKSQLAVMFYLICSFHYKSQLLQKRPLNCDLSDTQGCVYGRMENNVEL